MSENGIRSLTEAEAAKWQALKVFAIGHCLTIRYQYQYNRQTASAMMLQEALQSLLLDILQNEAKRRKPTLTEAARGARPASSSRQPVEVTLPSPSCVSAPPASAPRGVIVSRIDPDRDVGTRFASIPIHKRPWEGSGVFCYLGMVYESTISDLIRLGLRKLDGSPTRRVRDILGAMTNPVFHVSGIMTYPPQSVLLTEDEDVLAWLTVSKASPLRLLVLLERLPPEGSTVAPQTPPPPGWTHIDGSGAGATVEELIEDSGDSDFGPITRQKQRPAKRKA